MITTETQITSSTTAQAAQLFTRVLVGLDRSQESVEAARQAAVLTEPDGTLTLVAGWTVPTPAIGVVGPTFANELNADVYREPAVVRGRDSESGDRRFGDTRHEGRSRHDLGRSRSADRE